MTGSPPQLTGVVTDGSGERQAIVAKELCKSLAFDAEFRTEHLGRLPRFRHGYYVKAFLSCGIDSGLQGESLADASVPQTDRQGCFGLGQVADEIDLFLLQGGTFLQLFVEVLVGELSPATLGQAVECSDHAAFFLENLPGREVLFVAAGSQRDDIRVSPEEALDFIEDRLRVEAELRELIERFQREFLASEVVLLPGKLLGNYLDDLLDAACRLGGAVAEKLRNVGVVETRGGIVGSPALDKLGPRKQRVFSGSGFDSSTGGVFPAGLATFRHVFEDLLTAFRLRFDQFPRDTVDSVSGLVDLDREAEPRT